MAFYVIEGCYLLFGALFTTPLISLMVDSEIGPAFPPFFPLKVYNPEHDVLCMTGSHMPLP